MAPERSAVLVVDDEPDLLSLIRLILEDEGYRVQTAANGRQALAQATRELPGLILLDMKMPEMSGWEFAREFRARFDRAAPIIVLTAAHDARARAAEVDAEGYLGKPFELDDLVATVRRYLNGRIDGRGQDR